MRYVADAHVGEVMVGLPGGNQLITAAQAFPKERRLIVNADDRGLSDGVTVGIATACPLNRNV